ncbi:hypothetical protein D3C72_1061930 [compost metagenome]
MVAGAIEKQQFDGNGALDHEVELPLRLHIFGKAEFGRIGEHLWQHICADEPVQSVHGGLVIAGHCCNEIDHSTHFDQPQGVQDPGLLLIRLRTHAVHDVQFLLIEQGPGNGGKERSVDGRMLQGKAAAFHLDLVHPFPISALAVIV